jgi:hypothetical protein
MRKPINKRYDPRSLTSTLYFKEQEFGEYYMRGGICWPMMYDKDGNPDIQGFAIMAGQDVETGIVHIFEQFEFVTIEHIIGPDHIFQYHGIAPWFNKCFYRYFGRDFYWHQPDELVRKYRLETIRSKQIEPKPVFIEVPWTDDNDAHLLVFRYVKLKKILFDKDSELHNQLTLAKNPEKLKKRKTLPAVHALQCVLAGLERFPWRKRV